MKRQLITLGILTASIMPFSSVQMPANALSRFTINETEGFSKSIGVVQNDAHYILQGVFGGNPADTSDSYSFFVPKKGTYTFVFRPSNVSLKMKNANITLTQIRRGASIKKGSNSQYLELSLDPGPYRISLTGQSSISPSTFIHHQVHMITPR